MSPTFGMHKLVYLAALTVLIDNYVNRKSEEKLDFLEKTAAWLTQNVTMFRQQSNAKCTKRKKQMNEEEEKEGNAVSEVSRQLPIHQNRPVTKMTQGYDRQHSVSTPMPSQNRLPVATKQSVHQVRDVCTATVTPTRQVLATHTDDQIQEEMSRMQAHDQDQDILAQAVMEGNIPMTADASETLSGDAMSLSSSSTMNLLDSMVLRLNDVVQ